MAWPAHHLALPTPPANGHVCNCVSRYHVNKLPPSVERRLQQFSYGALNVLLTLDMRCEHMLALFVHSTNKPVEPSDGLESADRWTFRRSFSFGLFRARVFSSRIQELRCHEFRSSSMLPPDESLMDDQQLTVM